MKIRINLQRIVFFAASIILFIAVSNCKSMKKGMNQKVRSDIEWVNIPSGNFTMGSPENEIGRYKEKYINEMQHKVSLDSFKMSKYEVTFEQYDKFCKVTKRKKPDDCGWGRGNRPVINISWNDAKAFADWAGCRLPSEAEWEYACRAGTTSPFNTGINLTTAQANYNGELPYANNEKGEFIEKTMPVGSYSPNEFGLYDMHGNVAEWCNDWAGKYSNEQQINPYGPLDGKNRITRGGCWINEAASCRSAYRNHREPDFYQRYFGFRLVSDH